MSAFVLGMSALADPYRDAYALALAWLDGDDERIADVLGAYDLDRQNADLLFGLLTLVGIERDWEELADLLYRMALTGAGRPS